MSPEKIEEAKQAVELYKAEEELKKKGVIPPDGDISSLVEQEGLEEGEEDTEAWEVWLDKAITYVGFGVLAILGLVTAIVAASSRGDTQADSMLAES